MQDLRWLFQEEDPRGGAGPGVWENVLANRFSKEELLARESIQNSVDAATKINGHPTVVFRKIDIESNQLIEFGNHLLLPDGFESRHGLLGFAADNIVDQLGLGQDGNSQLLYVEDYGGHGLGGRMRTGSAANDHFRNLCLNVGVTDSSADRSYAGGSFGFGKTVYANNSNVNTVVFYSRFRPDESTEDISARLLVCSWLDSHAYGGQEFTGRAWYGKPDCTGEPWALQDDEAHEMARLLGFIPRSESDDQIGTSVLVLGSDVSMSRLKGGIEKWWWPRLRDQDLTIELYENGARYGDPRPLAREDLRNFVDSYEIVSGRREPDFSEGETKETFRRTTGSPRIGSWAAKSLATEESTRDSTDGSAGGSTSDEASLVNCMALMRSSRMVVQYLKVGRERDADIPIQGVYVADEETINQILRMSEPPDHSDWQVNSPRLNEADRGIVQSVLRRVRQRVQSWQARLRPASDESGGRIAPLERLLAQFINGNVRTGPPPPPRGTDPFHLEFVNQGRTRSNGESTVTAKLRARLREELTEPVSLQVRVQVKVVANDNRSGDGSVAIPIVSADQPEFTVEPGGTARIEGILSPGQPLTINVESEPFDQDWDVELSFAAASGAGSETE